MLRLVSALLEALRAILAWLRRLPREAAMALGAAGPDSDPRPERLWLAFALVLPIALAAALVLPRITLVMSPSIDAWAVREAPGPIARGDYVRFTLRHPIAGPAPVSVTKLALCLPGDRLTKIEIPSRLDPSAFDGRYFCNGNLLGTTLPRDHEGNRLAHMMWSGVVPPGMIYVGSHHPHGFDSRYFGLVPIEKLTRMARLL
ncbi:S26 family signal peptidase [Sphingopyxis alaskensis]|jgi:type IV secretory pathway protease TraF|uniref:S26 family signal peptidase n=1 Tax=Sphingopyxis alaskensis TaxID=117207 RepID=UPI0020405673|nr:S26 family signal peptidase [Sphingopyxis alaskensis]MCM3420975.1 S26 family signal peptidase [Sphingopyxis alaskensis]